MNTRPPCLVVVAAVALVTFAFLPESFAQSAASATNAPPFRGGVPRPAPVQVSADGHITFRILATNAQNVSVNAVDIPGLDSGIALVKNTSNVWEGTVGPVQPGEYRYNFNVDGLQVVAPRNPATSETATTSESNDAIWSLVNVPGSDLMDTRNVPHGAVETVTYFSKALNRFRRMHVYTPPGYEKGSRRYPVLYLLHGTGDSDDAWTTVGRAGFIMDNLIADGKAKPMIVVMPAGHTALPTRRGGRGAAAGVPARDRFEDDFSGDVMPFVESHYRVDTDRAHRAIAGLSMGGRQALDIAVPHLDQFAYLGVFSSGSFRMVEKGSGRSFVYDPAFEEQNKASLDNPKMKKGLKLVWFAIGRDDFLLESSRATVEMLKQHNFNVVFEETTGAHSWINWRNYLGQFAPLLFR
ncbi:MAG: alpha/beta hydrolase-fold protein [Verrucomicrobiota bacterium]